MPEEKLEVEKAENPAASAGQAQAQDASAADPYALIPEEERELVRNAEAKLESLGPYGRAQVLAMALVGMDAQRRVAELEAKLAEQGGTEKAPEHKAESQAGAGREDPLEEVRRELRALKETIAASEREQRQKRERAEFERKLDTELGRHEVLREDEQLRAMVRRAAVSAHIIEGVPLDTAVRREVEAISEREKRQRESWIKGKLAAPRGEAGSGRALPAVAAEIKAGDLRSGRIAQMIKEELEL